MDFTSIQQLDTVTIVKHHDASCNQSGSSDTECEKLQQMVTTDTEIYSSQTDKMNNLRVRLDHLISIAKKNGSSITSRTSKSSNSSTKATFEKTDSISNLNHLTIVTPLGKSEIGADDSAFNVEQAKSDLFNGVKRLQRRTSMLCIGDTTLDCKTPSTWTDEQVDLIMRDQHVGVKLRQDAFPNVKFDGYDLEIIVEALLQC